MSWLFVQGKGPSGPEMGNTAVGSPYLWQGSITVLFILKHINAGGYFDSSPLFYTPKNDLQWSLSKGNSELSTLKELFECINGFKPGWVFLGYETFLKWFHIVQPFRTPYGEFCWIEYTSSILMGVASSQKKMSPSTRHKGSLNGLMKIKKITYYGLVPNWIPVGDFGLFPISLCHHHQNTNCENIFWWNRFLSHQHSSRDLNLDQGGAATHGGPPYQDT